MLRLCEGPCPVSSTFNFETVKSFPSEAVSLLGSASLPKIVVKSFSASVCADMLPPASFVVLSPALAVSHPKRAKTGPQAAGTSNSVPFAKGSQVRNEVVCVCGEGIDRPLLQPPSQVNKRAALGGQW